jgi:Rab GDP dissociation inhibitor
MNWRSAFDGEAYDVIILGTGFTECLLSGLLAVEGKRILHLDRNNYYGGASASLRIGDFYKLNGRHVDAANLGNLRDYSVDCHPKFLMAGGQLVKALIHTGVVRYLDFRAVAGSFVYRQGSVNQVPTSSAEAMSSPLMSMMEKARCTMFFRWIDLYNRDDDATWTAGTFTSTTLKLDTMSAAEFLDYWSLEPDTKEFVCRAIALCHSNEQCTTMPADELVMRIKLYKDSLLRLRPADGSHASNKSPYLVQHDR